MLHRIQTPSGVDLEEKSQPFIITVGDVDEAGARKFSDEVSRAHTTGQKLIAVVIDSFGGDAYSLAGMLATLDASTIPVVTIVESKAMSCGAILFAAGTTRIAAPTATFLIHDVSSSVDGKTDDIKVDARETERLQAIFFHRLDTAAGKKSGYFEKLMDTNKHADLYLNARDAKRHGLATHIGLPRLTTEVVVTTTLTVDDRQIRIVQ